MKRLLIVITVLQILSNHCNCQYLQNFTRVDSLGSTLGFEETILNSNGHLIDLSMNYKPGHEAPLLLTEMDSSGIVTITKRFKFFSDSLNFYCNGTPLTSGTQFVVESSLYSSFDSSYYFNGTCVATYFTCLPYRTNGVLKLNQNLDTVWFREYGAPSAYGINFSADTGLIVSMLSNIRKLNPINGDTIWSRGYLPSNGSSYANFGQNRAFNDSEFILGGGANLFAHVTRRGTLTKFNQEGDILWAKAYGDTTPELFHKINLTNDSSYIIVNEHDYGNTADASVIKISKDGTFLWGKYYEKPGKKVTAYDIVNTPDNNYFLTLTSLDTLSFVQSAYLLKLDSAGSIIWSRKFNPPVSLAPYQELLKNFIPTPDGGFYINGTRLIKIDSTGYGCNFVNDNPFTEHNLSFVTDTILLVYQPFPPFYEDTKNVNHIYPVSFIDSMWVDSCLNTTSIEEYSISTNELSIYPNPVSSKLTISNIGLSNSNVTVTIYDVLGKEKMQQHFMISSDGKTEMDVSSFASGIYFIKVINSVQKFVKM